MHLFLIKRFVVPDPASPLNCYLNKSKLCLGPSGDSLSLLHVHEVLQNTKISEIDREVVISRTNQPHSFVYVISPLMRRGWGKLEPNSYSDEYKRNGNSWVLIHLCIEKTDHLLVLEARSLPQMNHIAKRKHEPE